MSFSKVESCRVCGNGFLKPILSLGPQCLQGQFVRPDDPDPVSVPVEVAKCGACGLVQSLYTVDPAVQFGRYFYQSGVSGTMKAHLAALAQDCHDMLPDPRRAVVLDIASNDGTLLSNMAWAKRRFGIDPCDVEVKYPGLEAVRGFFPNDYLLTRKFDLVTTVACLYSVPDPVEFASSVKKILAPDGLWVVEVADLRAVLNNVAYDYWCSEHCSLFSPATLLEVCSRACLKVIRSDLNGSNGGSRRFYITHVVNRSYASHPKHAEWQDAWATDWSNAKRLSEDEPAYERFASAVDNTRRQLKELVCGYVADGKVVHSLAASTKSGVVLQACGLNRNFIAKASDRDPRKVGLVMPGTRIPIVSEEESRADRPDLYVSGLGSMFRDELVKREREAGTRGKIVFALPYPETVSVS